MLDTTTPEPQALTTSIATPVASMCVAAVMNEITEILEARFAEKSHRTLRKHKDGIVHRKETFISNADYDIILQECLTTQLKGIYEKFYHNDNAFCIELASRVCATVQDKHPDDVRHSISQRFETYAADSTVLIVKPPQASPVV